MIKALIAIAGFLVGAYIAYGVFHINAKECEFVNGRPTAIPCVLNY